MKINKSLKAPAVVSVFLTIIPIVSSSFLILYVLTFEHFFASFSNVQWLFLTFLLVFTSIIALTPPTLLAMIFGYFLSFWALPYLFLLNMAAILLVYLFTVKWLREPLLVFVNNHAKSKRLLEQLRIDELKVIFLAKLSPVLPFALTNFVFGLSGAKLKNVLLGGFLGMIPRTILAVWVGAEAVNIVELLENPNQGNYQQLVILILVIISTFGLVKVIRKSLRDDQ